MGRRLEDHTPKLAGTESVAKSAGVRGLVVLALVHEGRASLVVAEDFVVEVEAGDDSTQAFPEAVAHLSVDLEVGQGKDVAGWALGAEAAGICPRDVLRRDIVVGE